MGITASGSLCLALVSRSLGSLAITLGLLDEAADLLREAVAHADREQLAFEGVTSRRLLATALLEADREANAAETATLIADATVVAGARGFARELQELGALATRTL